jgi:hypothetical protein
MKSHLGTSPHQTQKTIIIIIIIAGFETFFYVVRHLDSTAPYLPARHLHSTAPYLPARHLDSAAPYLPARHLDSTAPYLPTGLLKVFFRSWPSLFLPSSSSSVFPVLSFVYTKYLYANFKHIGGRTDFGIPTVKTNVIVTGWLSY